MAVQVGAQGLGNRAQLQAHRALQSLRLHARGRARHHLHPIAGGEHQRLLDLRLGNEPLEQGLDLLAFERHALAHLDGRRVMRQANDREHLSQAPVPRRMYKNNTSITQAAPATVPYAVRRPCQPRMARSKSTVAISSQVP